jgi:hypothetical protein
MSPIHGNVGAVRTVSECQALVLTGSIARMNLQRTDETPRVKTIEKVLGNLCTHALRTFWILEVGRPLLALDCVQARVSPPGSEKERDHAQALRKYLEDAVKRIESPQNRIVLEAVYGVGTWNDRDWRRKKAAMRRKEAGKRFRGSDGTPVKAGTIRQHHEPKAIRLLAAIIWRDEKMARGEPLADESGS